MREQRRLTRLQQAGFQGVDPRPTLAQLLLQAEHAAGFGLEQLADLVNRDSRILNGEER